MNLTQSLALVNKVMSNTIEEATLVKHNKTEKTYIVLNDNLIECTNGREDKKYVLYVNSSGMVFCREREEFYQKFTKL